MKKLTHLAVRRRLARLNHKFPSNPDLCEKAIHGYVFDSLDSLCNFRGSDLQDVTFKDCDLTGVSFAGAELTGVKFIRCKLERTKLIDVKMIGYSFKDCTFEDVKIIGSTLYTGGFWDCTSENLVIQSSTLHALMSLEVGSPTLWKVSEEGSLICTLLIDGHSVAYTKTDITVDWETQPLGDIDAWDEKGATKPFSNRFIREWWKDWMPTLREIVKKGAVQHTRLCGIEEMQ